eukprot:11283717-Alexandrium_andersonii.AAC.1
MELLRPAKLQKSPRASLSKPPSAPNPRSPAPAPASWTRELLAVLSPLRGPMQSGGASPSSFRAASAGAASACLAGSGQPSRRGGGR